MHGPPEIETPPAAAQAAEGREKVHSQADNVKPYPASERESTNVGWRDGDAAWSFLEHLFEEHFVYAPNALRDRFYGAVSSTIAGDSLVHLARVRHQTTNFEFDVDGTWAVVVPIFAGRKLSNWAAFDVDELDVRSPYFSADAVGLDLALWDASHHPKQRLLLHYDVWSYLRADCCGCLPINWRRVGLELLQRGVAGIVYPDDIQGRKADSRLRAVLRMPPSFVKSQEVA